MKVIELRTSPGTRAGVVVWVATHEELRPAVAAHGHPDRRFGHRAGRYLLRAMLGSRYPGQPCADATVTSDPTSHGKPWLVHADGSRCDVEFSISHSRTHVAVAVSECGPVGVDTESRAFTQAQLRSVARRILADDAAERLAHLPPVDQPEHLIQQWCAKESVLKATGEGLSRDLRSVEVPLPLPLTRFQVDAHLVRLLWRDPVVCLAYPDVLEHGTTYHDMALASDILRVSH